jgi:hypothetical protein
MFDSCRGHPSRAQATPGETPANQSVDASRLLTGMYWLGTLSDPIGRVSAGSGPWRADRRSFEEQPPVHSGFCSARRSSRRATPTKSSYASATGSAAAFNRSRRSCQSLRSSPSRPSASPPLHPTFRHRSSPPIRSEHELYAKRYANSLVASKRRRSAAPRSVGLVSASPTGTSKSKASSSRREARCSARRRCRTSRQLSS